MRPMLVAFVAMLAGCSALAPPPVQTGDPAPPVAPAEPVLPASRCVHMELRADDPTAAFPVAVSPTYGLGFTATLANSCGEPFGLRPAPLCGGRFVRASVERNGTLFYLDGAGAAFTEGLGCDRLARYEAVIPAGSTLETHFVWNGSLARRCADDIACWTYAPADEGMWHLAANAWTHDGDVRAASAPLLVYAFCADVFASDERTGQHLVTITIANRTTHHVSWDSARGQTGMTIRHCGAPGPVWVRYQDEAFGIDESALLVLEDAWVHLRPSPLRLEPSDSWSR